MRNSVVGAFLSAFAALPARDEGLNRVHVFQCPHRRTPYNSAIPSPRGAFAIVTNAGWDAVKDADAPLTNGGDADGEVVWS